MRTRFTWIVAILALATIGFLMACSTKYSSSNNGLVVVPSYGSLVMQSFSLDLANGHTSEINNDNGPPTNGIPTSVILDPAGAFAYLIVYQNPAVSPSETGIAAFSIASDGKLAFLQITSLNNIGSIPVTPVALTMDSAGKFLFVANSGANGASGSVSVLAIGSNAGLTEIAGSPFALPPQDGPTPSPSALAVTPTGYPSLYSPCSLHTPPATENLYVADSVNNLLLNYSVDTSSGALTAMPLLNGAPGVATATLPSGVAVDPCNRFVYVSNTDSNNVSAYTICSAISLSNNCPSADFSLQVVANSPFAVSPGDGPGPLSVDAYGNFLYVVDTGSSQLSGFRISSASGSLTSEGTYATGIGPNSIAVRSDDSWLFVANFTSSTVSQYAITPATGTLAPQGSIVTLNNPTGVAVK